LIRIGLKHARIGARTEYVLIVVIISLGFSTLSHRLGRSGERRLIDKLSVMVIAAFGVLVGLD
jgi:hypothetical protein